MVNNPKLENGSCFFIIIRMFSMNEYNLLQNTYLHKIINLLDEYLITYWG